QHGGGGRVGVNRARRQAWARVGVQRLADARQLFGQPTNAMILPQFAPFDRPLVIAVLLAASRVEAPGLNRRPRTGGDVHVAPRRRNAERGDPVERPTSAKDTTVLVDVAEPRSLGAEPFDPHLRDSGRRSQTARRPALRTNLRMNSSTTAPMNATMITP